MIKIDIVRRIASEMGLNDRDALTVVDETIEAIKDVVCEHGRLEIRDFGVFQVKQRKARIGRNPRNKKEYPIAPHKVVTFKVGKNLNIQPPNGEETRQAESNQAETSASAPESDTSAAPNVTAAPPTSAPADSPSAPAFGVSSPSAPVSGGSD